MGDVVSQLELDLSINELVIGWLLIQKVTSGINSVFDFRDNTSKFVFVFVFVFLP
jgi:hypothetical protein